MNKRNYQTSFADADLQISWAQFAPEPLTFADAPRVTGARRQGVLYERKAQDYIAMALSQRQVMNDSLIYIKSPWLCYKNKNVDKLFFCQPDGLIVELREKKLTIVEIKLQHTSETWYQVRKLYQPVVSAIYPGFQIAALEIVKWLDPHIPFPETFKFCEDVLYFDVDKFGVHIFNNGR